MQNESPAHSWNNLELRSPYQSYPSFERRLPRATFTRRLHKICERLDTFPVQTLNLPGFWARFALNATLYARSLWVVGSYARGASTCGDLDLVFDYELKDGVHPPPSTCGTFLGRQKDVRVYVGTPAHNSSKAVFSEAILVWQPGMDWKAAIAGIAENPLAGRFPRLSDAIPLRLEQLNLGWEEGIELLKRQARGELQWRFTPLVHLPDVHRPATKAEEHFAENFRRQGAGKAKLLPAVLGYARLLQAQLGEPLQISQEYDAGPISVGATHIYAEQLAPSAHLLDTLAVARIACVPKLSTRGPNGFWTIERGPMHPLVQTFARAQAWVGARRRYRQTPAGWESGWDPDLWASVLEIFPSYETALAHTEEVSDALGDDEDMYLLAPRLLTGPALLEHLATVDVLDTWNGDLPLSAEGVRYCLENEGDMMGVVSPETLGAFLSGDLDWAAVAREVGARLPSEEETSPPQETEEKPLRASTGAKELLPA